MTAHTNLKTRKYNRLNSYLTGGCFWGICYIFLQLHLFTQKASAQSIQEDITFILKIKPIQSEFNIKKEPRPEPFPSSQISELKLLFLGSIRVYQNYISAQDLPSCNFVPSCSRFSNAAFRRTGFLRGILLTSDRLQRCHGLPGIERHYLFLPGAGKYADPIEDYLH